MKVYWQNSNFQLAYFIAGKCHTADEAYRVLKSQLDGRETAIAFQRRNGIEALLQRKMRGDDLDAIDRQTIGCFEEACRERDFINLLIERLQPHRKYAHLPDHEAHQACQLEEWAREFAFRAETYIASTGSVPADQLAAMRLHPWFEEMIAPRMTELLAQVARGEPLALSAKPLLPALLENKAA